MLNELPLLSRRLMPDRFKRDWIGCSWRPSSLSFTNVRWFLNYKARFGGHASFSTKKKNQPKRREKQIKKEIYAAIYTRDGPPFWIMIVTCRGSGRPCGEKCWKIFFIYPSIKGTKWNEGFLLAETEGFLLLHLLHLLLLHLLLLLFLLLLLLLISSIDPSIVGVGGPVTLEPRPRWVQLCFGSVQMGFLLFFLSGSVNPRVGLTSIWNEQKRQRWTSFAETTFPALCYFAEIHIDPKRRNSPPPLLPSGPWTVQLRPVELTDPYSAKVSQSASLLAIYWK